MESTWKEGLQERKVTRADPHERIAWKSGVKTVISAAIPLLGIVPLSVEGLVTRISIKTSVWMDDLTG